MKPKFPSLKYLIIIASITVISGCDFIQNILRGYNHESTETPTPTLSPPKPPLIPKISTKTPTPTLSPSKPPLIPKIREKAEKETVFISRGAQGLVGSGVIIGQSDQTIYILTALHVIGIPPQMINDGDGKLQPEDPYEVTTNDGEKLVDIGYDNYTTIVKPLPNNVDLAILELKFAGKTNSQDRVATLTSSVRENMPVYLFGYIPCSPSAKENQKRKNQFSDGKVFQVESKPQFDDSIGLGGYDLHYNNNTVQGMSGSPVFDELGRVIAIHAKTNKQKYYNFKDCQPLASKPNVDYGDNLGISIKIFASLKSSWPSGLQSILNIDPSGANGGIVEPPSTPSVSPTPKITPCGPFVSPGANCRM
ncbi:serine protease [Aetokthonos hydrillicola Thurmond2011]|jgi:hypothetical protein|uniref:Serine protease n=1 Tax=Aetokthonos hydrillicola Thurmond2011 TaxID=2712845 RepID=A0AAP5I8I3_9CYAN|nr:serine protease [Aetokthonos hydrillicola]MBO3460436.1 trypsin-like peptidase domain-containing protein [Aetokthonos hydrillicola CCALA 1050]MBW4588488.1 serine protease [Aetokthonos hydrillicola CCALA 1050]MDR9896816.1 serine protease [Aetokthonos hydrillicola Thurmond2011]